MRDRSVVLLLTATVDPGQTVMVTRLDPEARLGDYKQALRRWLGSRVPARLVFCENSGYDLSTLQAMAAGADVEVEFLSYRGNETGALKGKGHAELGIIQHALAKSQLIQSSDIIVKCTGRLTVRNADVVLPSIAMSEFDVMCTLKGYLSFADSRLFAATPEFYSRYLVPRADSIDDTLGHTFEHALACAIGRAISERKRWRPFPIFPVIDGISATDGKTMTNPLLKRLSKIVYHRMRNFIYRN